MHPVKAQAVIRTPYPVYGLRHFVIDYRNELRKVIEEVGAPGNPIIVRVNTPPADDALYHLAAKFGAAPDDALALMQAASAAGGAVGRAFTVVAKCRGPAAYRSEERRVGKESGRACRTRGKRIN